MTDNHLPTGDKRLEWVPVSQIRVSPRAQRDHSRPGARAKITQIAADFDPDKFGVITASKRDGKFWLIDGGHRYHALLELGWQDQQVQCWVYHGLTEEQEATLFLDLNNVRPVTGLDKFKVAVVAERKPEIDIDRLVRSAGLSVGGGRRGGVSISCIAALTKVYAMGEDVLWATLNIIREAYGRPGFSGPVVEGMGLFVSNYGGNFDLERLVSRLEKKVGGVNGLLGRAAQIRGSHGVNMPTAVAASIVETYNQGRGGTKLTGWWQKIGLESKSA